MYAQIIYDTQAKTLVSASTMDKEVASDLKTCGNKDAAAAVGRVLAQRAQAAGLKQVCFDRGRFKYHGRVASLADAARAAGLEF
jgi:large subunit ribosomal protein L18